MTQRLDPKYLLIGTPPSQLKQALTQIFHIHEIKLFLKKKNSNKRDSLTAYSVKPNQVLFFLLRIRRNLIHLLPGSPIYNSIAEPYVAAALWSIVLEFLAI